MKRFLFIAITLLAMLCSCYHDRGKQHDALPANDVERRLDSISFESNHHSNTSLPANSKNLLHQL